MGARRVEVPRSKFEVYAWLFMRLSGVALIFLALGHLAIMHLINTVHDIDVNFVARRWASLGWRTYDAALLALALLHGFNGLRYVIDDYVHGPRANRAVKWIVGFVGAVCIVAGSAALILFRA